MNSVYRFSVYRFLLPFLCLVFLPMGESRAEIALLSPAKGETVSTVSPELRAFLELAGEARRSRYMDEEYKKEMRSSLKAVPISFTWDCTDGEQARFVIHVSEKEDFSEPAPFFDVTPDEEKGKNRADLVNFLIGRSYFWRVEGTKRGEKVLSKTQRFETDARPPRIIDLPKVGNVRDIGGWTGIDGKKVRQGMIYRSQRLNYNSPDRKDDAVENAKKRPGKYRLTDEALAHVRDDLGWKTDLDL